MTVLKPIPVSAAKKIAQLYGYDQVIVIARRVGEAPDPCGEHVTTYGRDAQHCSVAARVGDFLKHQVMKWPRDAGLSGRSNAAARDVIAERERHVTEEGWTPEHDDDHDKGELATAAACYAASPSLEREVCHSHYEERPGQPTKVGVSRYVPVLWPWAVKW